MRIEREDAKVGLIVALALLIFGGLLFQRTLSTVLRSQRTARVLLTDVSGLAPGTPVILQGLEVGRVRAIDLQREGLEYRFVATLTLRPDVVLWKNTRAVVVSNIVGGSFLDLRLPPLSERRDLLPPEALIEGGTSSSLATLIDRMQSFVANLDGALTELRTHVRERGLGTVLEHPQLKRPLQELESTLREARLLVSESRGVVQRNGTLLEQNLERLDQSLTVLHEVLESRRGDLEALLEHLVRVAQDLEGLSTETRAFLRTAGPEAEAALQALNRNLRSSEELLQILKAKPNRLLWGTPSPSEREAARRRAEAERSSSPPK